MKTLSKRLFAFFMAFCMIVPMSAQSVSAADTTPSSDIPGDCIAISGREMVPLTTDPIDIAGSDIVGNDEISPYLTPGDRDMGVGVRSITIYPLGYDYDTETLFYDSGIYKQAYYVNYAQTQALELTKSETLSLMLQLQNAFSSVGDNCALVGWYLKGRVEFHYKDPQYLLFQRCGTGINRSEEEEVKSVINAYTIEEFEATFAYPQNMDFLNDYYYVGVSGGCYYRGPSGNQTSALFGIYAYLNS